MGHVDSRHLFQQCSIGFRPVTKMKNNNKYNPSKKAIDITWYNPYVQALCKLTWYNPSKTWTTRCATSLLQCLAICTMLTYSLRRKSSHLWTPEGSSQNSSICDLQWRPKVFGIDRISIMSDNTARRWTTTLNYMSQLTSKQCLSFNFSDLPEGLDSNSQSTPLCTLRQSSPHAHVLHPHGNWMIGTHWLYHPSVTGMRCLYYLIANM